MALTKIDDRGLKTPIDLQDNEQIRLGTGNDFKLYHDGSHTYFDNDTGHITATTAQFNVNNFDNSENCATFVGNGAVNLFYDGTKKLETTSSGVTVTGTLEATTYLAIADQMYHAGDADTTVRFPAADTIALETAGSERFRVDSSGRVMIGTTTEGTGAADDFTVATTGSTGITVRSGSSNDGSLFFSDGTSGADEYRGFIQYGHGSDNMLFGTNGSERMQIDSAGNVGIGTSSPSTALQVHKDWVSNYGSVSVEGSQNALVGYGLRSNGTYKGALIYRDGTSGSYLDLGTFNGSHPILFKVNATEEARIDSDGLKFNGDSAAANALDDYEEGTFTPRLGGTNNSGSYYVEGTGSYIKIGRQISVSVRFNNVTLSGSSSGSALISHMPFTAGHSPTNGPSGVADNIQYYKIGIGSADIPNWYLSSGTTIWYGLISRNANTWSDWNIDNFHSSGIYMNFTATYFTA